MQWLKTTNEPVRAFRIESRWPAALAILVVLFLLTMLPSRVRLFPSWFAYGIGVLLLVPMVGLYLTAGHPQWCRAERASALLAVVLAEAATFSTLSYLMLAMLNRPEELSGRQLFTTSVAAWVTNVLTFSIAYWQIDRGGPEARGNDANMRPDWLFPQTGLPEQVPPDWRPTYVDYLFLSFSTATAFSTTDVLPLTSRAKILMMVESAISLATLVVVAARAINLLGS